MKVLFTGSRNHPDELLVQDFLKLIKPTDEVIVGDCPTGVDKFVRDYCEAHKLNYTVYYADWDKHGRAAGPIRNKAMVDTHPDIVIGYPYGESRGTKNCIKQARAAGILTYEVKCQT